MMLPILNLTSAIFCWWWNGSILRKPPRRDQKDAENCFNYDHRSHSLPLKFEPANIALNAECHAAPIILFMILRHWSAEIIFCYYFTVLPFTLNYFVYFNRHDSVTSIIHLGYQVLQPLCGMLSIR